MNKLALFKGTFIEPDVYDDCSDYSMKVFHNCAKEDGNFLLTFIDLSGASLSHDNDDDFIAFGPQDAYLLSLASLPYDFSQFEKCQPITNDMLEEASENIDLIRRVLTSEIIEPRLLIHLMDEPDDEVLGYLTNNKSCSPEKIDFWRALFKNKESILNFYDALFWYIFDYRNFNMLSDHCILNIQGLYQDK